MSTINVDIVDPQSGNNVTVSGVAIDSPTTDSIAVGTNALASVTTGLKNIGIGTDALSSVTFGNTSVAIGYEALKLYNGFASNVAIGAYALSDLVSNIQNTAIGTNSLQNTTSINNTSVCFPSLLNNTTGSSNDAFGAAAGLLLNSGSFNTFLGTQAGSSLTSGNSNVLIGFSGANPGFLTSGDNNIIIGSLAFPSTPIVNNEITLGNSSNTVLRCAVTTITSLSDARDKKEIEELPVGLEFVEKLKPVKFTWDDRNEKGKHDVEDFGFIAQDLKASQEEVNASYLGLVYEANPEKLEASYGKLLPVLVKAIQELSSEVKSLKEELETLKNK
jgi:hypothetical protein